MNGAKPSSYYSVDELYNMSTGFIDTFMSPENAKQAAAINSTVFSEDCLGRVDATGTFVGRELNTEYVYGLFAAGMHNSNPDFFSLIGNPTSYQLTHWSGAGNVVSLAFIANFSLPSPAPTIPFEIDIWLAYDKNRQISQYDATMRYFQWSLDSTSQQLMAAANIKNSTVFQDLMAQKLASSICSIAESSCNGTNQQVCGAPPVAYDLRVHLHLSHANIS